MIRPAIKALKEIEEMLISELPKGAFQDDEPSYFLHKNEKVFYQLSDYQVSTKDYIPYDQAILSENSPAFGIVALNGVAFAGLSLRGVEWSNLLKVAAVTLTVLAALPFLRGILLPRITRVWEHLLFG